MLVKNSVEYRPLGVLGAEIPGVDLGKPVTPATVANIRDILLERELLLFRNQHISDEQYVRFAGSFGPLEGPKLTQFTPPGHPELLIVSNRVADGQPLGLVEVGHFWHSDGSYLPEVDMYTILYGIEIPHAADGTPLGDTLFISATAAYDGLSSALKKRLEGLVAIFSYDFRYAQRIKNNPNVPAAREKSERQDQRHPIVRAHPVTGRKTIFANEGYVAGIEGMSDADSKLLLDDIYAHLYSEKYQYRHRWQPGDVLLWDNNSTQHNAVGDYRLPQSRLMKRTTIKTEWPRPVHKAAASASL